MQCLTDNKNIYIYMVPAHRHQEQVEAIVQDAGVPKDKDMAEALAKASAAASTWVVEIHINNNHLLYLNSAYMQNLNFKLYIRNYDVHGAGKRCCT